MKIRFYFTDSKDQESELKENKNERIANVRLSSGNNDLMERRRYDFPKFWRLIKSNKIQLSGKISHSKKQLLFRICYGIIPTYQISMPSLFTLRIQYEYT